MGDRSCYNCGEGGHISRECSKPRQGGGGGGGGSRVCYNCNEVRNTVKLMTAQRGGLRFLKLGFLLSYRKGIFQGIALRDVAGAVAAAAVAAVEVATTAASLVICPATVPSPELVAAAAAVVVAGLAVAAAAAETATTAANLVSSFVFPRFELINPSFFH